MRFRRTLVGLSLIAVGFMGLTSACATAVELDEGDDDVTPVADASTDAQTGRSSSSSSGSSSGRSSSSGGRSSSSSSSSGGSDNSSSGSNNSSGGSGMLPPGPQPGTACEIPNERYRQGCGLCGVQEAKCGAGMVVTEYSECTGEVPAAEGCVPGTVQNDVSCGYCGTQNRTCTNSCRWSQGACNGQVTGNSDTRCRPGETRITTEDCPTNQTVTWTCYPADYATENLRCRWNIPSASSCSAPPTFINAPPSGSETLYRMFEFLQSSQQRASSMTCPASGVSSTQGGWLEIKNPTASAVRVNISNVSNQDLVILAYTQPTKPTTEAQLKACAKGNDVCFDNNFSDDDDACISDVPIPANSSIWVYSGRYSTSGAAVEHDIRVKTL